MVSIQLTEQKLKRFSWLVNLTGFRWASAGAGVFTLILFMPGIFQEHNVHQQQQVTQSKGEKIISDYKNL